MDLEILKIASNTDNYKVLKKYTHNSKLKNPICGDEMQITVKVVDDRIVDFGYQCKSCVYCQASVSLLSRNSINKKILSVNKLLKLDHSLGNNESFLSKKFIANFSRSLTLLIDLFIDFLDNKLTEAWQ